MMGIFFYAFLLSADFFQEYHQSVKLFEARSGPTFCQACFGSKLFAKLQADDKNGHSQVKSS